LTGSEVKLVLLSLRLTLAAAVERELVERQYLVARLEESLEERLK